MRGQCQCGNIAISWQLIDHSLVPRACQCVYCCAKSAAYVSKQGTKFTATIHRPELHRSVSHGSETALFHECVNCGELVFVTAELEDGLYGALNANCLQNKYGFAAPVETNFSASSKTEKTARWRENWCHPVIIKPGKPPG